MLYWKIDNSTKTHHTMLLTRNCFSAWKLTWIILRPLLALLLDLKKSCPRYISAQKISTLFWCTGWAWNWQILFRFASKSKAVLVSYYEKKNNNKLRDFNLHTFYHYFSFSTTYIVWIHAYLTGVDTLKITRSSIL